MRMSTFSGEQLAQVNNPDPFAAPVWRSPVYHTPGWIIAAVQVVRSLWAIARFLARHPVCVLVALVLIAVWRLTSWPGPLVLIVSAAAVLVIWRIRLPVSFDRCVFFPALSKWRRWRYHRHWAAVMTIGRLAAVHRVRVLVPVLGKVTATPCTDVVSVRLVSG